MPKNNTSVQSVKNSNGNAPAFDKLTKAELIELLFGDIKAPITPDELYRATISIVSKWYNDNNPIKDFEKKFAKSKYVRIFVMRENCKYAVRKNIFDVIIKRRPCLTSTLRSCGSLAKNKGRRLFLYITNF